MLLAYNNFVYFSEQNVGEEQLRAALLSINQLYWYGDAYWFIGTSFKWSAEPQGDIYVHMFQSEFSEHTPERFGLRNSNRYPIATPYRYKLPINSLPD